MFGKLSLSAIPYDNPITITAVGGAVLLGLAILGLITYYRKWTYLYKEWLTSLDHKKIGIMYIILALVMLLRGFADAILMRSQQAVAAGGSLGFLTPDHFDQIFSAHGSIMIIFMAMPFMVGLMNIVVPQQIGARDVAVPFMNSLSLWLTTAGALLVMVSLGCGEFSKAGWSGYAPLTEQQYSPGVGVDYWIWAFQIAGIGPRDLTFASLGTSTQNDALGGKVYAIGSAELSVPTFLPEQYGIRAALFTYVGTEGLLDAYDKKTTDTTTGLTIPNPQIKDALGLRASAGLSIFWKSPMGPIRFDFSQIIKKEPYDITETFRFSTNTRF